MGDVILFEPTGAAEAEGKVAGETEKERAEGARMLAFDTAQESARRLLFDNTVKIRYVVDVLHQRSGAG